MKLKIGVMGSATGTLTKTKKIAYELGFAIAAKRMRNHLWGVSWITIGGSQRCASDWRHCHWHFTSSERMGACK